MPMTTDIAPKQFPLSIIEGFFSAQIAYHFHANGLLDRLSTSRSVKALAREFDYDEAALAALLEFLCQSSDIIVRAAPGRYLLRRKYRTYYYLGFQLDKFIGAYGPAASRLDESLRSSTLGRRYVNREVQAKAYFRIQSPPNYVVVRLVREYQIKSLLDLGCGQAPLLIEFCRRDSSFRGWGIDESSAMCRIARQKVKIAKLGNRIQIVHGDARNLGKYFDRRVRDSIESLQSKGLFNELFRTGKSQSVRYLEKLRRWFPGKLLFIVDYYGKLTHTPTVERKYQHTLIHDLIQVLSAQGVPPPDLRGWMEVYKSAGCQLEHAYEGDDQGFEWFVHVVRL